VILGNPKKSLKNEHIIILTNMTKNLQMKFSSLPPLFIVVLVIGTALLGYYLFEQVSRNRIRENAAAQASGAVLELTQETFDQTIQGEGLVLVEFGAPWCPACRAQAPIIEALAATHAGRARIAKVDVDRSAQIANQFQIQGIPAIIIFKDGSPVRKFVGLTQKDVLAGALNEFML